jgi:hypothetical protein
VLDGEPMRATLSNWLTGLRAFLHFRTQRRPWRPCAAGRPMWHSCRGLCRATAGQASRPASRGHLNLALQTYALPWHGPRDAAGAPAESLFNRGRLEPAPVSWAAIATWPKLRAERGRPASGGGPGESAQVPRRHVGRPGACASRMRRGRAPNPPEAEPHCSAHRNCWNTPLPSMRIHLIEPGGLCVLDANGAVANCSAPGTDHRAPIDRTAGASTRPRSRPDAAHAGRRAPARRTAATAPADAGAPCQ